MGKNNRHQKNLKAEKAKVKLKTKKTMATKHLPKGTNVTDTTFRAKKITIRESVKRHQGNESLILDESYTKELMSKLEHRGANVRQETIKELKEMLTRRPTTAPDAHLRSLLRSVGGLTLDKEKDARRDALKVLNLILGPISNDRLVPFSEILISYLCCSMTHIDPNIKEDSLLFVDVLLQNCGFLLAAHARKVLPNFLDMISKLKTELRPGRQLVTTLNSKSTTVKWRRNVLSRLSNIMSLIIGEMRSKNMDNRRIDNAVAISSEIRHAAVHAFNRLDVCEIDFSDCEKLSSSSASDLDRYDLAEYTKVLAPLVVESWLEVAPEKNSTNFSSDTFVTPEASNLLKSISEIVRIVTEYFELLETENRSASDRDRAWLRNNFLPSLEKNLLDKFPYALATNAQRSGRDNFQDSGINERCDEQNFSLCQAYLWISTRDRIDGNDYPICASTCDRIFKYVNERLKNWSSIDTLALPHLIKLLRVIFLRAGKVFYKIGRSLSDIFSSMIKAYAASETGRDLQIQLLPIFKEIVLDRELRELHNETAFKSFVTWLPDLLLKSSVHNGIIEMLNGLVLRHGRWISDELAKKCDKIIENASKIEITGTGDQKRSRLMICNLFYFIDQEIYY